jgi:predicted unusual protein kinase regulating ubiquinone biosynthesis (AarF/ABC1/UbiB family)
MEVICLEYGVDSVDEVFEELSEEPVAAASLA